MIGTFRGAAKVGAASWSIVGAILLLAPAAHSQQSPPRGFRAFVDFQAARLDLFTAEAAVEARERMAQGARRRAGARDDLERLQDKLEKARDSLGDYLDRLEEDNDAARSYRDALVRHRRSMLDLNTAAGCRLLP